MNDSTNWRCIINPLSILLRPVCIEAVLSDALYYVGNEDHSMREFRLLARSGRSDLYSRRGAFHKV